MERELFSVDVGEEDDEVSVDLEENAGPEESVVLDVEAVAVVAELVELAVVVDIRLGVAVTTTAVGSYTVVPEPTEAFGKVTRDI